MAWLIFFWQAYCAASAPMSMAAGAGLLGP